MVEVFKTNVNDREQARMLIDRIQLSFTDYTANFDLQDCDKILRVKSRNGFVQAARLIELLNSFGFVAEVLPDDQPVIFLPQRH